MSRREFIAMTSDAEWAAYRAGAALANRDQYMHNAGTYLRIGSIQAAQTCVRAARDCNRDYLKYIAEYRAAKAAETPKRKRA